MKILKEFFSSLKKEEVLPEEEDTSPKLVNIPSEDMKPIVDVYKNIISLRFEIGKTMVEHRGVEDVMFSQVKKKQKQMDELVHKLKEKYDAVKIAKAGSEIVGGKGGGGRSDFAQAGGLEINKIDEAFEKIKSLI